MVIIMVNNKADHADFIKCTVFSFLKMKIIYLVAILVYYVVVMGNTSLVSSDYINKQRQLFDALQLALINDSVSATRNILF